MKLTVGLKCIIAVTLISGCDNENEECCTCPVNVSFPTVCEYDLHPSYGDTAAPIQYQYMWEALAPLTQNDAPDTWSEFRDWVENNGCNCE